MNTDPFDKLDPSIFAAFDRLIQQPSSVGVACSGGGDSVALLITLNHWARARGLSLRCATVNHGLRPEAEQEAAFVAGLCETLGVRHDVLTWEGWDQRGNLQEKARQARYGLLSDWARSAGLACVAVGHTQDDVVETFLMRLARGSGVDGLAQQAQDFVQGGVRFIRPMADVGRQDLRDFLQAIGQTWIDDPSNDDLRFDRVRIRKALPMLAELGLDHHRLLSTARHMRGARNALEAATQALAQAAAMLTPYGSIRLERAMFDSAAPEIRRRLLAHALKFVSQAYYKPGLMPDDPVWPALERGKTYSCLGCLIVPQGSAIEITREAYAMPKMAAQCGLYDNRWQITGATVGEIGPLGEKGLQSLGKAVPAGVCRATLAAIPAIWLNGDLHLVPLLDKHGSVSCQLVQTHHEFLTSILTH